MALSLEGQFEILLNRLHTEAQEDHDKITIYRDILRLAETALDDYHLPECNGLWDRTVCDFYGREYAKVMPKLRDAGYIVERRRVLTRTQKAP